MSVSPMSNSKIKLESSPVPASREQICLRSLPDSVKWMFTCRWALALIGFFGFVLLYALRVNMSVAIVCMINNTALQASQGNSENPYFNISSTINETQTMQDDICQASTKSNTKDGEFVWTKSTQGLVLSSFFYGYLVMQVPGGWLAQRYGGKRILGYFMLLSIASTLLVPLGARVSPYLLIALRILNGIGQGAFYPSMHEIWSKWAPPLERSKLISVTYAGAQVGNVLGFPISAVLCDHGFAGGWSSCFYVIGLCGAVWFILWMIIASDSPSQHPRISDEERDMIETSIGVKQSSIKITTPWLQFAKSPPVWAIIVAHTCANWGTYTLLTNIPAYMKEVLKFDIKSNGIFSAIPYIVFWALINVSGLIADYMRAKGVRTVIVRKIMLSIGMAGPGTLLIVTGYMSCASPYTAVAVLSLAVGCSGFQYPGYMVNHVDIAPPFAGLLYGISNTAATVPGVIAPYAVSLLTPNATQAEWRVVFYLSAAIYYTGGIVFCFLADGEIQSWVRPYMNQDDESMKEKSVNVQTKDTVADRF